MTTSRTLSWSQLVHEADPLWSKGSINPIVWEFSNGRRFMDQSGLYSPAPDSGLTNNGGFLIDENGVLPTTDPLVINALWSQAGFVSLSSKGHQYQLGMVLLYPGTTMDQLRLLGGAGIKRSGTAPSGSGQIFNNGNFICVA